MTEVSFVATAVDIKVQRNDSPVIPITVTSDAVALNVAAGTFVMTVGNSPAPSSAGENLFTVAGVFETDGTDGRVNFQPTIGDTALDPGVYFYDVEMTLAPSVRTILKGSFTVDPDISNV